jgi:hypothetical protein
MTRGKRNLEAIENAKFQYGMWLGLPVKAREEAGMADCQEEFARRMGISPETVCRWKNDKLVLKVKENAVKLFWGGEMAIWEFMKTLREGACDKNGKPADKRLFAEIVGLVGKKEENKREQIEFVITHNTKDK